MKTHAQNTATLTQFVNLIEEIPVAMRTTPYTDGELDKDAATSCKCGHRS
jgi:hypothetical protein